MVVIVFVGYIGVRGGSDMVVIMVVVVVVVIMVVVVAKNVLVGDICLQWRNSWRFGSSVKRHRYEPGEAEIVFD